MAESPEDASALDRLRYRLRLAGYRLRPMPKPLYVAATPTTAGNDGFELWFPPTAQTLGAAAMSDEAFAFAQGVLDRLTPGDELVSTQFYQRWGRGKFGEYWRYANLLSTLWAAATCVRPKAYLEIGVHRGRSTALVGAVAPECAIYGFDLWIPDYAGMDNPGPDFVRKEIAAVGHTGQVELISGDSRQTVPAFLRQHPDLFFDMITIDGDKSIPVASADYANTLGRLKVGGIVVSDDVQMFPWLERVWDVMVRRDRRYVTWQFSDAGRGVSAGIRVAE
jgi:predicted O-methyltransferase YrrM